MTARRWWPPLAHRFIDTTEQPALGLPAETLTIFRTRPWNGPLFRRLGSQVMPEDRIGQRRQA